MDGSSEACWLMDLMINDCSEPCPPFSCSVPYLLRFSPRLACLFCLRVTSTRLASLSRLTSAPCFASCFILTLSGYLLCPFYCLAKLILCVLLLVFGLGAFLPSLDSRCPFSVSFHRLVQLLHLGFVFNVHKYWPGVPSFLVSPFFLHAFVL